ALPRKYYLGPMAVLECHIFVPSDTSMWALAKNMRGEPIAITTTRCLRETLTVINEKSWQARKPDLIAWRQQGLPDRIVYDRRNGEYVPVEYPEAIDPLQQAAKCAYATFARILDSSDEYKVPIVVDQ